MKYREVSKMCSKDCGRERRPGQRECRECHAASMRALRRKRANPMEMLDHALDRLAQNCKTPLEFRASVDARAMLIAAKMRVVNRVGDGQ